MSDSPQPNADPTVPPLRRSPRQAFLDAIEHRCNRELPFHIWLADSLRSKLDLHLGGPAWRQAIGQPITEPWFLLPCSACDHTGHYTDAYGSRWQQGAAKHLTEPILAEPCLAGFSWPDLEPAWRQQQPGMAAALAQAPSTFRFSSIGSALFERAWMLRGFENTLCDMLLEDDFCAQLFDGILQHQQEQIARLLSLDVDAIWFSDDWSGQQGALFSPALWRRWIKPRLARLFQQVHQAGKKAILHSCGNVEVFIPELIEIGLDCLQSVQPEAMDPIKLKREFGADLCFWGGVPVQGLPGLSPAAIRDQVARLRDAMSPGGGYICSPAKALGPEVPLDKVVALLESIADIQLN